MLEVQKEGRKKQARSYKQQSKATQHTQGSHFPKYTCVSFRCFSSKQQKDETSSNPVDPSSHPPAATTSVQLASKSSEMSAPNNTGPEPQPTVIPSTFPDHCDIPDSVLGAHSIARDNTNNQSGAGARDDKQRVRELRLWSARQRRPNNPFARALKDVTPGAPTDLVCQILSVSLTEPVSECSVGVLRVWDGTKMPQRRLDLDLSGFMTVADSPLLENAEVFSESVVVYGRELVKKVAALLPAQFVCLQNLRAKTHTHCNAFRDHVTALELRLQPSPGSARETTIRVLTSDDIAVSELKCSLKDALKVPVKFRSLPPDVVPSPITRITHSNQEALPLSAVAKLSQQEQTPLKFRCIVKVLGITPDSVEELVRLRCPACKHKISITTNTQNETPCPKCSNSSNKDGRKKKSQLMDPTYFFKLLLVDETGNLIVYASGRQAANFLSGFPPAVFFRQPTEDVSTGASVHTHRRQ